MKSRPLTILAFTGLFIALGFTGCQTDENGSVGNSPSGLTGNIKTQGVYTTLAIPDMGLVLPGSGYMQKSSFGPGETPAAVIAGYGIYNQQQMVTLQLVESDTGRTLFSKDYYATYGKVVMQTLVIRLSGNYQLNLTQGGNSLDSCQFTVTRTNSSGMIKIDGQNSAAKYAQGLFNILIGPADIPDYFAAYDDKLIYNMLNSVTEEAGSLTNEDLFAQRFPGKVVIQCNLDSQGHLKEPKILENTLDDDCGRVFKDALLERSPYDTWPQDAVQKFGSDNRELTLTINFD